MPAIIIGTHGKFCEGILASSEMICGKQDNIACITFEPGESMDLLKAKYDEAIKTMDTSKGVLIMVDLLNGSPFNASIGQAASNDKIEIVTGVNMPMILNVVLSRGRYSLEELANIAKNSGTDGIQTSRQVLNNEMEEL